MRGTNRQIFGMTQDTFMKKYGIFLVLLVMVTILLIVSPTFRTGQNMISILQQISTNGVLALGMVFIITAEGIDLSIGSMVALSSVVIGTTLNATGSIFYAIILAVIACGLCGLLNGFLVAKFNLFPFVVTLSTQLIIRGVALIISQGKPQTIEIKAFRQIGLGKLGDVLPYSVIILLAVAVIAYILLHWTKFGRYVYAVGDNIHAALASGVNVFWTRVMTFVIMGITSGIAGVILTSRINASQPNVGVAYEVDAIAACVIGGTSFTGGVSNIPGTIAGIIIIGVIYNGMNLLGISSFYQMGVKGLLIIGAVMLDMLMNKKRNN